MHWGDINVMGIRIPWYLVHAPPFLVMQAGATLRKHLDMAQGVVASSWKTLRAVADEIPFIKETSAIDSMLSEGWRATRALGATIAGMTVPTLVQNVAQWTDEKDSNGDPVRRYPRTLLDYVKLSIPGLREQVPDYPKSGSRRKAGGGMMTIPFHEKKKKSSGMSVTHL